VFAVILPIVGVAMLAGLFVVGVAIGADVRQKSEPGRSILILGWLLVVGLWCLGFTWVILVELRRRQQSPSASEQEERHKASIEDAELLLDYTRASFRTGSWFFLSGVPGLCVYVAYRWLGSDPPDWIPMLSLPLTLAPLYWMHAVKLGIGLWWRQGRPSKWLGYSALTLAAFCVGIMIFSFQ